MFFFISLHRLPITPVSEEREKPCYAQAKGLEALSYGLASMRVRGVSNLRQSAVIVAEKERRVVKMLLA